MLHQAQGALTTHSGSQRGEILPHPGIPGESQFLCCPKVHSTPALLHPLHWIISTKCQAQRSRIRLGFSTAQTWTRRKLEYTYAVLNAIRAVFLLTRSLC